MLTIFAKPPRGSRYCDGVSRRNFIKIGALGLGGLALPQLLQAESAGNVRRSHKAIIMIYLPGGPPHQDMFDLKLDAPSEIRGEFRPMATNVPGVQICEHLPRIARLTDKLAIIRSVADAVDDHSDFMCLTGRRKQNQPPGGWPTFGAIASKLLGPLDPGVPPFVGLEPRMQHRPYNAATPGILEAYGKGDPKPHGDAAPMLMEQFLVARRLVEAGARAVTVAFGFWDYHGNNFKNARADLPLLDQGVSALVTDLHQRGLDKDVSVIVWGEFGRTPTINKDAGRDHWPRVSCALLAGGGMKTGQVIGATDRLGGEPTERPVTFGEVFATLYHNLGLDVNKVTIPDFAGRPQFLVPDGAQPMRELVG